MEGSLRSAAAGPVAEGNVGGGAGMATYEFKGGTGTSSRRIEVDESVVHEARRGARKTGFVIGLIIAVIAGGQISAPVLKRDATVESIGRLMGGTTAAVAPGEMAFA